MTRTTPRRRIILHLGHRLLTEDETFITNLHKSSQPGENLRLAVCDGNVMLKMCREFTI